MLRVCMGWEEVMIGAGVVVEGVEHRGKESNRVEGEMLVVEVGISVE